MSLLCQQSLPRWQRRVRTHRQTRHFFQSQWWVAADLWLSPVIGHGVLQSHFFFSVTKPSDVSKKQNSRDDPSKKGFMSTDVPPSQRKQTTKPEMEEVGQQEVLAVTGQVNSDSIIQQKFNKGELNYLRQSWQKISHTSVFWAPLTVNLAFLGTRDSRLSFMFRCTQGLHQDKLYVGAQFTNIWQHSHTEDILRLQHNWISNPWQKERRRIAESLEVTHFAFSNSWVIHFKGNLKTLWTQ